VEWFWWDRSLSQWPTGFLQCFDAVGWVIWPVKIVPEMTYKVSSGSLNLCSINQSMSHVYILQCNNRTIETSTKLAKVSASGKTTAATMGSQRRWGRRRLWHSSEARTTSLCVTTPKPQLLLPGRWCTVWRRLWSEPPWLLRVVHPQRRWWRWRRRHTVVAR